MNVLLTGFVPFFRMRSVVYVMTYVFIIKNPLIEFYFQLPGFPRHPVPLRHLECGSCAIKAVSRAFDVRIPSKYVGFCGKQVFRLNVPSFSVVELLRVLRDPYLHSSILLPGVRERAAEKFPADRDSVRVASRLRWSVVDHYESASLISLFTISVSFSTMLFNASFSVSNLSIFSLSVSMGFLT